MAKTTNGSTTRRVTFPIYGLSCGGGGALTIERALQHIAGVQYIYVNPAIEMAYVAYDPALCSVAGLEEAIVRAGLQVGKPIPQ